MRPRVRRLAKELLFAFRVCDSWATALRLTRETLLFHAANHGLVRRIPQRHFTCRLRLRSSCPAIHLRTFSGDLFVFYEVFLDEVYRIPESLLKADQVRSIMDCGANVGLTSIYFADRYPHARIVAVEANAENYAQLLKNLTSQMFTPVHCCVSDADGVARMSGNGPAWGYSITTDAGGIETRAARMESIMAESGLNSVGLLKLDIEGAERSVIRNGGWLEKVDFVILELHGDYTPRELEAEVGVRGFSVLGPEQHAGLGMTVAARRNPVGEHA